MNIFVVDRDPRIAATMLCDKHVVKMTLESAQLLSFTVRSFGLDYPFLYKTSKKHMFHPATIWAKESFSNFNWLLSHADELGKEYTRRYHKTHKSSLVIDEIKPLVLPFDNFKMTPFALCMPDEYKCADPVLAYRSYYLYEKKDIAKWNHSEVPDWVQAHWNKLEMEQQSEIFSSWFSY